MLDVHLLAMFKPQRKRLVINFFKGYLSILLPGITFDTLVSTMPEQSSTPSMPRSFNGINHLKLPAQSLTKTMDFYTRIFPFTALPQYDHFTPDHRLFACMFTHAPTGLLVEVRYAPEQTRVQRGWDPITWGVSKRADLEAWGAWLDANAVRRSRTFTGVKGWVMACEDPDGRIVRLYVDDEEHEWTDHPDKDDFRLGVVQADPEV
jgi:catechol 2,3-dioxygenase-like lactoylglutathione lyase family enzyme